MANLYNYRFASLRDCLDSVSYFNSRLNHKGIYMELMKNEQDFYLLYVYREKQLYDLLCDNDTQCFLREYGYSLDEKIDIATCISILKNRLCQAQDFPHEIGIFLGYPLLDVKEFIRLKGKDFALCGEWKVYYNVQNALHFFGKLKKCKDIYLRLYVGGRSLYDMTVNI